MGLLTSAIESADGQAEEERQGGIGQGKDPYKNPYNLPSSEQVVTSQ